MRLIQTYAIPLFFALVIHVGLGFALYQGWSSETKVSSVVTPKVVNAKLVVLEPKAKPKSKTVSKKPAPVKQPPVKKPEPKKPDLANKAKDKTPAELKATKEAADKIGRAHV